MKLTIQNVLPLGLLVVAAGYIAFSLSLPNERMIGDAFGYDPGGRVIQITAAAILAATALWELIRHWSGQGAPQGTGKTPVGLLLAHILLIMLFIALFRPVGFILATSLTLYIMIALNLRSAGTQLSSAPIVAGLIGCAAYAVVLYSVLRGVVRLCFIVARQYSMPALREPSIQAIVVAAVLALTLLVGGVILPRLTRQPVLTALLQSAVGITLIVYVVFRLLFLVQLPAGLLTW
jgi:hypothetical protein